VGLRHPWTTRYPALLREIAIRRRCYGCAATAVNGQPSRSWDRAPPRRTLEVAEPLAAELAGARSSCPDWRAAWTGRRTGET
jgi:hypothetical protein